jgi:competence/damage-inducible protein CinA-like protein
MDDAAARSPGRRLLTAELLSIGSELTVGETRDTNAGEIARALTTRGVRVVRITALPDRLDEVTEAVRAAMARVDLVISTGGLGPTPDDLTRESIAAAFGETPIVDPSIEAWLRELWRRRGQPFPELNLKQAWLIPSAEPLPNPNGTAPGWFVRHEDGPVVVALPGPPREMRPMLADEVIQRLELVGLGTAVAVRTYRLTGIGESQLADRLGEALLRRPNPEVATYARADAVDVRISAVADRTATADEHVEAASREVLAAAGEFVWATGDTSWPAAIGARLIELGWALSLVEIGSAGQFAALLGDVEWLRFSEAIAPGSPGALAHGPPGSDDASANERADDDRPTGLEPFARRAMELAGTEVGLAMRLTPRRGDTAVSITVVTPTGSHQRHRLVFLDGANGRSRAALAAAAVLLEVLRAAMPDGEPRDA